MSHKCRERMMGRKVSRRNLRKIRWITLSPNKAYTRDPV